MPSNCYAVADTPRAVVALLFPFLAVIISLTGLRMRGFGITDIPMLAAADELGWVKMLIGALALMIWLIRYYPPAWAALVDGPCLVVEDRGSLILPGARRVPRDKIISVRIERNLLHKRAVISTKGETFRLPLLFVRKSSDPLLRSLAL